jgi:hypothetical protein
VVEADADPQYRVRDGLAVGVVEDVPRPALRVAVVGRLLFARAADDPCVFEAVLERYYYGGVGDPATLQWL